MANGEPLLQNIANIQLNGPASTFEALQPGLMQIGGSISGTGGLTQAGLGTTSLDGTATYTGPTNVTAGLLEVDNPRSRPQRAR